MRLLVGHSFGGAAVIAAAHECPTVAAVASIGAPYDPRHVEHNYDALVQRIEADGEAPFLIGGKALTLKRHFIEDVRAADLRERIRTLRRALLVMHSPTDNTVGIANASEIFRAARHPRSFVSLEGADHLLTGKNQAARAARIISAWADPVSVTTNTTQQKSVMRQHPSLRKTTTASSAFDLLLSAQLSLSPPLVVGARCSEICIRLASRQPRIRTHQF